MDESSFGARRVRGKKGRGAAGVKHRFRNPGTAGIRSTRRSSRMMSPTRSRYRPRFGPGSPRKHSHPLGWLEGLQWAGGYGLSEAFPRPSVTNLREVIAISTALNHSDHMLNGGLQNSRAFPGIRFIYTSKNMNSDERKSSLKLSRPLWKQKLANQIY